MPDFEGRSAARAGNDRSVAANATAKPPNPRDRRVFIALIECDLVPKVLRPRRQEVSISDTRLARPGRKGSRSIRLARCPVTEADRQE